MIFQDTSSYENCGVYTVEVNPFKPHLFALGGNDVLIMDIEENITNPQIFAPAEENPHEGSMISAVSWNKKVSHILASASRNGLTTVWDLKSN
jgi:protein transport protein SEC31